MYSTSATTHQLTLPESVIRRRTDLSVSSRPFHCFPDHSVRSVAGGTAELGNGRVVTCGDWAGAVTGQESHVVDWGAVVTINHDGHASAHIPDLDQPLASPFHGADLDLDPGLMGRDGGDCAG